ncbi:pentatricopeptide repeat-containing protein At3g12770-like isoform X2 [Mercurialis annua]|uniref:pentatricopeptide repeat-containing protein At3g12770-like isoform X2 n=1 Tax=Mercurialis annua TaxID=3986 RepID=UPI00216057F8|nr:pentatricopeptide repeat-containing protein At3g12770-like isoform X2 [Mercurialis annua]
MSSFPTHKLKQLPYTTINTHFTNNSLTQPLTSLQCGAILQSLTNTKSLTTGQHLHAYIITSGNLVSNTYLSTKLAAFYANCGQMANARIIFDGIVFKSSFLWNSMIRGYACNGYSEKALALYQEMKFFGQRADKFTYPFVIKACGDLFGVEIGRRVHGRAVINGFDLDMYVSNSLLAMYLKFMDMSLARMVFDRMPKRDSTSWNTMISGYVKNGKPEEGLAIFDLAKRTGLVADDATLIGLLSICAELVAVKLGKAVHGYVFRNRYAVVCNNFLMNSLIEMYCKCNSMVDARRLFEKMELKDTVSWNSLISGYARNAEAFESLRLFCRLVLEGTKPDQITFIIVLGACHQVTAFQFGMSVHSCLAKKGFGATIVVGTALIDMYVKCGALACAHHVFEEIPRKNLVCWSAMISGYGIHGMGRDAISLFHEMLENNICPDEGVLTSVLSACSHTGLVSEGRAGYLDEAFELIDSMIVNPSCDIWAALLNACRLHRNIDLAEISAEKLFELNPRQVGGYICLSNMYAAEKRWDDVERIRALMRQKGLTKSAGCSFVELNKTVHRFLVGDKSHPQMENINSKLKHLNQLLKEAGYKPDTSSVFYNVDEETKEKMLWDHSERLAIAFALINTGSKTTIRITKNLRVCGDCHIVIKLISKLLHREIIMRDIRRFHHFKDGLCSCGDYW